MQYLSGVVLVWRSNEVPFMYSAFQVDYRDSARIWFNHLLTNLAKKCRKGKKR